MEDENQELYSKFRFRVPIDQQKRLVQLYYEITCNTDHERVSQFFHPTQGLVTYGSQAGLIFDKPDTMGRCMRVVVKMPGL